AILTSDGVAQTAYANCAVSPFDYLRMNSATRLAPGAGPPLTAPPIYYVLTGIDAPGFRRTIIRAEGDSAPA
ncbi:MAG: hypothetical protein OEM99_08200, partial [Gammaproteobacteria bacterium]|nr:hypothetical protein [Gammaproteobacteria bacterium]